MECWLWYLAEYENGEFKLNKNPDRFSSVEDYLMKQGRFRHLTKEDIEVIIEFRNKKWERIKKSWAIANVP